MKSIRLFIIILFAATLIFGCAPRPQKVGTIEGHVTIGPLTPVVRVDEPTPTPNPEVYAAREVVIFKADGKTIYTRLKINPDGNYQSGLPIGTYVIDINHIGIDTAKDLPLKVEITENAVTRVDIDIDTGIR